jgi:hypothetical protein
VAVGTKHYPRTNLSAGQRFRDAFEAVVAARPTDPATMGRQLRWLVEQGALDLDHQPSLLAIADRLEALARSG